MIFSLSPRVSSWATITLAVLTLATTSHAQRTVHEAPARHLDPARVAVEAPPEPRRLTDARVAGAAVPVTSLGRLPDAQRVLADLEALLEPGGPTRIGHVRSLANDALTIDDAIVVDTDDAQRVWSFTIRTDEAQRVRLHLRDVALDGAVMILFSDHETATVRGPFHDAGPDASGAFWTPSVAGDTMHVEITGPRTAQPVLTIDAVVHIDRDPGASSAADGGENGDGVLPCHLDAQCAGGPEAARRATGQINYVSGSSAFVCTGTVLNDLDPDTEVPWFITAAHCLNTQSEVSSMEVVWDWERTACTGGLPDYDDLPRDYGGVLVVTSSENDMTFIRLVGGTMASGMAGFTTETGLDNAYGFHHPSGDFKRAVRLDGVGTCPGCVCLDPTDFDYYDMTVGLVEGGSSGSGVFNGNGQLAGQLYGRCSDTSDPDDMNCGSVDSFWAVYGEFESTWEDTDVSYWLSLGGTIRVDHNSNPLCQNGTPPCPFITVGAAHALAWDGARLLIQAGPYPEAVTLSKAVEIMPVGGVVTIGQ